jgi:putative peptide zinc metalloprotease protein
VKRLTLFLLALAVAVSFAGIRPDVARAGDDNAAVAINTKDGASLFKLAFDIRKVAGEVVDSQNAAVAYSSCERCRTVAIAIQIVLVTGSPSVVTPTNLAIAVNESCTLCETFASAYQFVLGTGGPVKFTQEGKHELHEIRKALKELRKSDLSLAELDAQLKAIVERIRNVLATQLVPVGPDEGDGDEGVTDELEEELPPESDPTMTDGFETVPPPTTTTETTTTETVPTETTTTTLTETTPP